MPKDVVAGARVSMARMGDKMYKVVANSSRPERALKDEVFRLCATLTPKETGAVLGRVYGKLGRMERTASMADYMKELYGSGSRKLFSPKPLIGIRRPALDKPGLIQIKLKGNSEASQAEGAVGGAGRGAKAESVVNLESVTDYCMNTASHYEEVKPIYDMLMELHYNKPNKEWDKKKKVIKARMDKMPRGYVTVYDTHIERHITNNVEKVEANGVGIMEKPAPVAPKKDGRKKSASTERMVKAVYRYNYLDEEHGYKRLELLNKALKEKEWIDETTTPDMFADLFGGKPKEFTIKWLGTQAELYTLIRKLFENGIISCTDGGGKWEIAGSHFVDRNSRHYTNWNKQRECKKGMSFILDLVLLLNSSVPPTGELLKRLGVG